MSQAGISSSSSGPVPPTVATSYTTDNGTAVPAVNILDVRGIDNTTNNDNGITVVGGLAQAGAANRVQVQLTNRLTGSATTTDATLTTIATLPLGATPGVYFIDGNIIGFDKTHTAGACFPYQFAARTDGATATEISSTFTNEFEEVAFDFTEILVNVSANNVVVMVQGFAATTVDWSSVLTFRFVS